MDTADNTPRPSSTIAAARTLAGEAHGDVTIDPSVFEEPLVQAPPTERYRPLDVLGSGGMGVVHRTHDAVLARQVARKTLKLKPGAGHEQRFLAEARTTGQLDHPNIPPVHDVGVDESGQPFFTMKLVHGRTLTEVIDELHEGGLVPDALERVLQVIVKVCDAVDFAHSRGIVHCDIKPQNVMIGTHGQVYVMDWGVSVRLPPETGEPASPAPAIPPTLATAPVTAGAVSGTAASMAPEQACGYAAAIGPWTDVFALGALLYEVLTRVPPYDTSDIARAILAARTCRFEPPERRTTLPLPPGLCEITAKAMSREPAERFATAAALRESLEAFLRGGGWFATRSFPAGAVIIRQGDPAEGAFVIVSGTCLVEQERDGRIVPLRTLGEGAVFGEAAILGHQSRTATVRAEGPVTVKFVTIDALRRELGRSDLVRAVVEQITARFIDLERQFRERGPHDTPPRSTR